jgi:hypothetical protein
VNGARVDIRKSVSCAGVTPQWLKPLSENQATYRGGEPLRRPKIRCNAAFLSGREAVPLQKRFGRLRLALSVGLHHGGCGQQAGGEFEVVKIFATEVLGEAGVQTLPRDLKNT